MAYQQPPQIRTAKAAPKPDSQGHDPWVNIILAWSPVILSVFAILIYAVVVFFAQNYLEVHPITYYIENTGTVDLEGLECIHKINQDYDKLTTLESGDERQLVRIIICNTDSQTYHLLCFGWNWSKAPLELV